jgi:hypothetical protein
MSKSVGKVVKSVGRGMYSEISKISTDKDMTIAKKKSSIPLGRGTMIIAKIAITNTTTLRSRDANIADITPCAVGALLFAFAKCYSSKIDSRVKRPRKSSTLPCRRFKNGHSEHVVALLAGQSSLLGEQLKTAGPLPSAASITSRIVMSRLWRASSKPPLTPLNDFKMLFRASDWRILAKKLLEILSSLERVSTSSGLGALAKIISESRAYSLALVINIAILYNEGYYNKTFFFVALGDCKGEKRL